MEYILDSAYVTVSHLKTTFMTAPRKMLKQAVYTWNMQLVNELPMTWQYMYCYGILASGTHFPNLFDAASVLESRKRSVVSDRLPTEGALGACSCCRRRLDLELELELL
jgi:hypothetical protein